MHTSVARSVSRREMFLLPLGLLGAAVPRTARAAQDAPLTPREALRQLYEGNARFAEGRQSGPHRGLERVHAVAPRQTPFAAVLGCADSRVPVELVFDQGFGDLFVTRVAGNIADPAIVASLEYATAVLGAPVVYVLGHSSCGAVTAAMDGRAVPGQVSALFLPLREAVRLGGGDLRKAIEANVRVQMDALAQASPVLRARLAAGELVVAGGVYDLASGRVTPVEGALEATHG